MSGNIIINCPECYGRKYHVIARQKGFSFDRAADGAILGGIFGGNSLGLALFMGIDGEVKKTWLQCDICGHVWAEK